MFELVYMVDGIKKKQYPQTKVKAMALLDAIRINSPVYQLISCEECKNYEAYKRGCAQYKEFLLEESGEPNLQCMTEEQEQDAIERVLDAPFEYDKDVAYYILCEFSSFADANAFYREVTA